MVRKYSIIGARNSIATEPRSLLHSLINFDRGAVTEAMTESLRSYVENPAFQPVNIIALKYISFMQYKSD
jgi:hypothetical protein